MLLSPAVSLLDHGVIRVLLSMRLFALPQVAHKRCEIAERGKTER